jgi:hypothetical protein
MVLCALYMTCKRARLRLSVQALAANYLPAHLTHMCRWLVTQRLGNMVTTGRIANRTAVIGTLRAFLQARYPELVAPVFLAPKGADALTEPMVGGSWTGWVASAG